MPIHENSPKGPYHFRYYILIGSFLVLFFNAGARFAIGIVFKPMIAEFGWSRSAISLAVFINLAVFALSLTVMGKFYDRYGPKWVILISTLFASAGSIVLARIQSLGEFFVVYGIILAIGIAGTSVSIVAAMASKWFQKGRGFAISLALSGNCLGQFFLIPVFNHLIIEFNWRILFLGLGIAILVINILVTFLLVKPDPVSPDPGPEKTALSSLASSAQDLNLTQAMRTFSFWMFLVMMFICGSGDFLVTTHLVPLITDHQISSIIASRIFGWFGLLSLAGIMVAGPFSDRIGDKIPIALSFVLRIFLFFLVLSSQTVVSFYIFGLLFGFTFLITAPLTTTLVGRLYGFRHVGVISGFLTTVHHLGGGLWAYLGGWIFDRTGSYRLIFVFSVFLAAAAVVSTLLIKEKRHPLKGEAKRQRET